jgi:hypothetical protein
MMRDTIPLALLGVSSAIVLAVIAIWGRFPPPSSSPAAQTHIVLVGASIGRQWHIEAWPARVRERRFTAESLAVWQFDKTEAIQELLQRPGRKFRLSRTYFRSLLDPPPPAPGIVILKECSSYFPGDLRAYKGAVQAWIRELGSRNIRVILATVAPVTSARSARDPGKQEGLLEYNRWVRDYARRHNIPVLDLEAALRTPDGAYLQDGFAAPDGSHLNAAAYAVLDRTLLTTLQREHP